MWHGVEDKTLKEALQVLEEVCTIRPMTNEDLIWVWHTRNEPDTLQKVYLTTTPASEEAFINEVRTWVASFVFCETKEGAPVGYGFLNNPTAFGGVNFGVYIAPPHRMKGYAIFGGAQMLYYAFYPMNCRMVYCDVIATNRLSLNTLLKHHFKTEGVLRDYFEYGGRCADLVILTLHRADYPCLLQTAVEEAKRFMAYQRRHQPQDTTGLITVPPVGYDV